MLTSRSPAPLYVPLYRVGAAPRAALAGSEEDAAKPRPYLTLASTKSQAHVAMTASPLR